MATQVFNEAIRGIAALQLPCWLSLLELVTCYMLMVQVVLSPQRATSLLMSLSCVKVLASLHGGNVT